MSRGEVADGPGDIESRVFDVFNRRFPYALFLLDPDFRIVWAGEGCRSIMGFEPEELIGEEVLDLVHRDDLLDVLPMASAMVTEAGDAIRNPSAASTIEIPVRVRNKSGIWTPVSISGRIFDGEGRLLCVLRPCAESRALDVFLGELGSGSGVDASLEAVLEVLKAQFHLTEAWLIGEGDGTATVWGGELPSGCGEPERLLKGMGSEVSFDSFDGVEFWIVPIQTVAGGPIQGVFLMRSVREGGPTAYDDHILKRTANLAALALARSRIERVLEAAANTDHLTGMLNRRAIEGHLERQSELEQSFPLGVLFIDLDGFKSVNDKWGHSVGDAVLQATASRMASVLREGDVVGRLGGDEFAVVCVCTGTLELESVRSRIEASMMPPVLIEGIELNLSVSVGIAIAQSAEDAASLLHSSDADMYERKAVRDSGLRSRSVVR